MTKKKTKKAEDNQVHPVFKALIWIFRGLYTLLSWIVKAVILTLQYIVKFFSNLFSKDVTTKSRVIESHYEPFRVVESLNGSFQKFEGFLAKNPSTIGIIIGARGTGKSAIGLKILENMKDMSRKKFFAMGFKQNDMPSWVKIIDNVDDIENNSFVLIDEGGILFSARKAFSDANKLLSELLLIARHKDLSVIFISQNSANLEINAIRQADYLILKPSSLLQIDFERKKIKEIYAEVQEKFNRHKGVGLTYIYSTQFKGFVTNPLPSFWTMNISKSFRNAKKE